jgi:hypothetical protein
MLEQSSALARKAETVKMIGETLKKAQTLKLQHSYISRDRRLRATWKADRSDRDDGDAADGEWNDDDKINVGMPDL